MPLIASSLQLVDKLTALGLAEIDFANSMDDFGLVYRLNDDRRRRLNAIKGRAGPIDVFLPTDPPNFAKVSCLGQGFNIKRVNGDELSSHEPNSEPSVLVLTNNVLANFVSRYGFEAIDVLRARWDSSIIAFHDYDCHHWFNFSFLGQLISDFYFPAHPNNYRVFSPYLDSVQSPLPIGSIQWSTDFLKTSMDSMCASPRADTPLGRHTGYPKFLRRNKVVVTINKQYSDVMLTDAREFHKLSERQKLLDWGAFKAHFVVPVNLDMPVRIFDALVTGGIPIVPRALHASMTQVGVAPGHYVTYSYSDVLEPQSVVSDAIEAFHADPIRDRIGHYMEKFHIDSIVSKMLQTVITSSDDEN